MTDDGLEPVDVTGRWVGFWYGWEKPGRYPIVADLRQTGNMITGKMYDQIRERSDHFDKIAEILEKQMPNDVRRRFEQAFRRFGTGTVRISRLPDVSGTADPHEARSSRSPDCNQQGVRKCDEFGVEHSEGRVIAARSVAVR